VKGPTQIVLPEVGLPDVGLPEVGLTVGRRSEVGLPEGGLPVGGCSEGLPEVGPPDAVEGQCVGPSLLMCFI